ncbi:DUF6286 domain-containing protein [Allostreptomyces psammosilenae]|uniref:DUF6286 domain-containing protein n=1 Tax=Allostreptomyces psammosilenae TaxID=1892865 RepID=A0A852ZNQ5_9ACTN|nr:DUF6286 domain-containing protein [Allostreptomyces psammosilenae]NYI03315.1 hypothetical protein [Allostreptomyces psammosilenae]
MTRDEGRVGRAGAAAPAGTAGGTGAEGPPTRPLPRPCLDPADFGGLATPHPGPPAGPPAGAAPPPPYGAGTVDGGAGEPPSTPRPWAPPARREGEEYAHGVPYGDDLGHAPPLPIDDEPPGDGPFDGAPADHRPGETGETGQPGAARRPWSARRLPSALLASVLLAGSALLLYDLAAVRVGRPEAAWRRWLTEELAGRRMDDPAVLLAAALAVLLGLWLVVLALTPGMRRLLPVRPPGAGVRVLVERRGLEAVLGERVRRVPGVGTARVRARRRWVRAEAEACARRPAAVREDVTALVAEELVRLGPARPPRVRVAVRPGRGVAEGPPTVADRS